MGYLLFDQRMTFRMIGKENAFSACYSSSADGYQQAVGQLVFREPFFDKVGEEAEQVAPALHYDFSICTEKELFHIRSQRICPATRARS